MTPAVAGKDARKAFDRVAALAQLQREMAEPPFHDFLRPQAVDVESNGTVTVRLPFRPEFRRRGDSPFIHGGVIASLADLTAHAAVAVQVQRMVPTIDLRIDYLRAAPEGDLTATGRILIVGRSIGRADVEITGTSGKILAVARGTFSTRESE
ncbi:MAG: PaaI family thioesterase [Rhizobiales bacterium]|nr:PaaI family thioesterase [Hyphomicrobiales bacterium]